MHGLHARSAAGSNHQGTQTPAERYIQTEKIYPKPATTRTVNDISADFGLAPRLSLAEQKMTLSQLVSTLSTRAGRHGRGIGRLLSASGECASGSTGSTPAWAMSKCYNQSSLASEKRDEDQGSSFRERLERGPSLDEFIQGTYSVYAPPPKVRCGSDWWVESDDSSGVHHAGRL